MRGGVRHEGLLAGSAVWNAYAGGVADPVALAFAAVMLLSVAALAGFLPARRFYGTSKSISRGLDRGIFSPSLFHQLVDFAVRDVAIQKRMVGTLLQQLVRRIPGQGECSAHDCRTYA